MTQDHTSTAAEIDRANIIFEFIQQVNKQLGKGYLNKKDNGQDIYEQAESWLPYLRYIRTENLLAVFENCIQTRTNAGSQLNVQNMLDSARNLISANRIKPINEKPTNQACSNCHGLGWEWVEVWLGHPDDEFSTPQPYQQVTPCRCENHPGIVIDREMVGKLMRLLAAMHPAGIPNVQMEQRAAEKLSELGYDLKDVMDYCDNTEPLSLIPVVRGIGNWYFKNEIKALKVPLTNEIAQIALRVALAPISDEQARQFDRSRQRIRREYQEELQRCSQCGDFHAGIECDVELAVAQTM